MEQLELLSKLKIYSCGAKEKIEMILSNYADFATEDGAMISVRQFDKVSDTLITFIQQDISPQLLAQNRKDILEEVIREMPTPAPLPEEGDSQTPPDFGEGFNACRTEVLTNLNNLLDNIKK